MPAERTGSLDALLDEVDALASGLRRLSHSRRPSSALSLPSRAVLSVISAQPNLTVPQIARLRGTSRQNVQAIADRMAAADLLKFVPNPDHQKSDLVRLTELGRQRLRQTDHSQSDRVIAALPELTEDEIVIAIALLARIRVALGLANRVNPGQASRTWRTRRSKLVAEMPSTAEDDDGHKDGQESVLDASPPEELPVSLL